MHYFNLLRPVLNVIPNAIKTEKGIGVVIESDSAGNITINHSRYDDTGSKHL